MRKKINKDGFEFASGISWAQILYSPLTVVNHTMDKWKKQVKTDARVRVIDECSETDRPSMRSVYIDDKGAYIVSSQKFFHDGYRKKVYLRTPKEDVKSMNNRIKEAVHLLTN